MNASNRSFSTTLAVLVVACPLHALPQSGSISTPAQTLMGRQAVQGSGPQKSVVPVVPPTPNPIGSLPFTINTPGYYQVTGDLTGVAGDNGITVVLGTGDVVIDLNGFELTGVPGSEIGVSGAGRTVVFNGTVRSWEIGVILLNGSQAHNLVVRDNLEQGMQLSDENLVQDCTIRQNQGIGLLHSGRLLTAIRCTVWGNGEHGISSGVTCFVQNCTVYSNQVDGIRSGSSSRISYCNTSLNGGHGIVVGQNGLVSCCISTDNVSGVTVGFSSRVEGSIADRNYNGFSVNDGGQIADCSAASNAGHGIIGGLHALVQRCTARANGLGIQLTTGGRITDCAVEGNLGQGIAVNGDAVVEHNSISSNGGRGILAASNANRIDGNHLTQNGIGIEVQGDRNLIVRNSLDSNGVQLQIGANNMQGPFLKTQGFLQNESPWANFDLSFPTTFP